MGCLHNLAGALEPGNIPNSKSRTIDLNDLQSVSQLESPGESTNSVLLNSNATYDNIYKLPAINSGILELRPWNKDANYFTKVFISAIALMKMTIHAKSGGSIEVMGMITGKITKNTMIVMDVYALPVEGTETRVNAQTEGYEYMVEFMQANKRLKDENIVGWYHSHPGYGCWLSGIDVSTQALNQNFQDPYLALVIDPVKTISQNKVEIGAFRTYSNEYLASQNKTSRPSRTTNQKHLPKSKRKDFGIHSDKYYSLDIEIFNSELDSKIISLLMNYERNDSVSWLNSLLTNNSDQCKGFETKQNDVNGERNMGSSLGVPILGVGSGRAEANKTMLNNFELQDENLDRIFKLIKKLQTNEVLAYNQFERSFLMKFQTSFEETIHRKLLVKPRKNENAWASSDTTSTRGYDEDEDMDEGEDSEEEEEDKKSKGLDFSDVDDEISMESSSAYKNDEDDEFMEESKSKIADPEDEISKISHFPRKLHRGSNEEVRKLSSSRSFWTSGSSSEMQLKPPSIRPSPAFPSGPDVFGRRNKKISGPNVWRNKIEEEHVLKKNKSFSLLNSSKLGKSIGQNELQELMTLDIQHRLFL